jgi:hypothetical protein
MRRMRRSPAGRRALAAAEAEAVRCVSSVSAVWLVSVVSPVGSRWHAGAFKGCSPELLGCTRAGAARRVDPKGFHAPARARLRSGLCREAQGPSKGVGAAGGLLRITSDLAGAVTSRSRSRWPKCHGGARGFQARAVGGGCGREAQSDAGRAPLLAPSALPRPPRVRNAHYMGRNCACSHPRTRRSCWCDWCYCWCCSARCVRLLCFCVAFLCSCSGFSAGEPQGASELMSYLRCLEVSRQMIMSLQCCFRAPSPAVRLLRSLLSGSCAYLLAIWSLRRSSPRDP